MATYNIYGVDSDEGDDPQIVATLNDDDTEIISAVPSGSMTEEELATIIDGYKETGLSATAILTRLAGSYGVVEEARSTGTDDTVDDEPTTEAETEVEPETEDEAETPTETEAVSAAAGDETAPAEFTPLNIGEGIMAMTADSSIVVTLLRRDSEQGAVYRHGGEWLPVVDPSVFDELTFVGVEDSAEATYDKYESQDLLVPIDHYYPSAEGPYWPHMVSETEDTPTTDVIDEPEEGSTTEGSESEIVEALAADDEAVTASVTLNSVEDLLAAIDAATDDPDLRWYVERRVAALGLNASLPWQQS